MRLIWGPAEVVLPSPAEEVQPATEAAETVLLRHHWIHPLHFNNCLIQLSYQIWPQKTTQGSPDCWANHWCNPPHSQELYLSRVSKRAGNISLDPSHPAHSLCERLPSGRRYRALSTRTTRHRHSTSSTLSLWTVTVWSTLQSSQHQNDQTQNQHIQHTLSVNGYRLVDATELWAPERPDTEPAHPAHSLCERLRSGRRYRALSTRTTRHRTSTSSTLSLWTVTVWSTLQSSEHQNDQTQNQHIQHTPSVNGYRLIDATELWTPERPDTEPVSSLRQSISWTHNIIYSPHTLTSTFKSAHDIPVHT